MVSSKIIFVLLAIGAFVLAGGGSLVRPALAQVREDVSSSRTFLTEQVKNIRNKTRAGEAGDSVG